jgi:hypothetical protein
MWRPETERGHSIESEDKRVELRRVQRIASSRSKERRTQIPQISQIYTEETDVLFL